MTPTRLTLTAQHVEQLRAHLLREDGLERVAYGYCSPAGDDRVLVEELVCIPDEATIGQSPTACRPSREVELDLVQDCLRRGLQPLILHSHPFDHTDYPLFSPWDDDLMDDLWEFITGHEPTATPMFAALSQTGITAAIYPGDGPTRAPLPVTVLGNHRLDPPLGNTCPVFTGSDTAINAARFDRSVRALGEAGQHRLTATHIALIGCGGLGDLIATELAMYGVGQFTLIDPDVVDKSNLPRLVSAADHHVSRPKVEVTKQQVWRQNPVADVTTVHAPVEEAADTLHGVDLIVAGVDRISTRQWLNAFAVRHLTPYIDAGVVITTSDPDDTVDPSAPQVETMEGYIQTVLPGASACFDCLDRGDPEQARIEHLSDDELAEELDQGYIDETQLSPTPAVVPLNGTIASLAVQLVAKLVTGYALPADYLAFEGVASDLTTLSTTPRETCRTCGPTGVLGRGTREPTAADLDAAAYEIDLDSAFALTPAETSAATDTATVMAAIRTAAATAKGLRARLQHRSRS